MNLMVPITNQTKYGSRKIFARVVLIGGLVLFCCVPSHCYFGLQIVLPTYLQNQSNKVPVLYLMIHIRKRHVLMKTWRFSVEKRAAF